MKTSMVNLLLSLNGTLGVRSLFSLQVLHSLRTADAFPVVASLPPTTGNASAVRRLSAAKIWNVLPDCVGKRRISISLRNSLRLTFLEKPAVLV